MIGRTPDQEPLHPFVDGDGALAEGMLGTMPGGLDDRRERRGAPVVVADRYELLELMGSGAMASVWAAQDLRHGRVVALKRLHAHRHTDQGARERFAAEARMLGRWDHPGLPHLYDHGEERVGSATQPWLALRLVTGDPVADLLSTHERLPARKVLRWVARTAEALAVVHAEGVVHRDVKPANMVITHDGLPVLIDFGIATAHGEEPLTHTGELVGSMDYVSPEQVLGRRATSASDVYSLGVFAHRCLTGQRPFERDSLAAAALAHVHDDFPPLPDDVRATLGPAVDALLASMTAKEPDARPSAVEVATALGHVRGDAYRRPA